jgi:hypothetical protein
MIGVLGRALAFLFAFPALAGFVAAVAVHVASLAGRNLLGDGMAALFVLHAGVFVVFVPMGLMVLVDALRKVQRPTFGGPRTRFATLALFVYCGATLLWMVPGTRPGVVTPVEALAIARVFSSGWMLFYFVPLAYFARRALASPTSPP